jgi:threonine/homoserine/homoserine lactone efflux protein
MLAMFDDNFRAFVIVAAALVISPGASMAAVTEIALHRGRGAALLTVAGINTANASLALASMLGLSAVFHQWPGLLRIVSGAGAVYLSFLGLRALWGRKLVDGRGGQDLCDGGPSSRSSAVTQGILTNLLNPSVVLFYLLLLPQFIRSADPFFRRFALLAATHVSMSLLWLSAYALAIGTLSERLTRPPARRALEILTGAVLVILGAKMFFG